MRDLEWVLAYNRVQVCEDIEVSCDGVIQGSGGEVSGILPNVLNVFVGSVMHPRVACSYVPCHS